MVRLFSEHTGSRASSTSLVVGMGRGSTYIRAWYRKYLYKRLVLVLVVRLGTRSNGSRALFLDVLVVGLVTRRTGSWSG